MSHSSLMPATKKRLSSQCVSDLQLEVIKDWMNACACSSLSVVTGRASNTASAWPGVGSFAMHVASAISLMLQFDVQSEGLTLASAFFSLVEPLTYFKQAERKSYRLNCLGLCSSRMARSRYRVQQHRIFFSFYSLSLIDWISDTFSQGYTFFLSMHFPGPGILAELNVQAVINIRL
ncbi:TPA: hypothetical protein ACH3X1_009540 [Trebouxia sp. C0004]